MGIKSIRRAFAALAAGVFFMFAGTASAETFTPQQIADALTASNDAYVAMDSALSNYMYEDGYDYENVYADTMTYCSQLWYIGDQRDCEDAAIAEVNYRRTYHASIVESLYDIYLGLQGPYQIAYDYWVYVSSNPE